MICALTGDGHAHVIRQMVVLLSVLTSYGMAIVCDPSSSIVREYCPGYCFGSGGSLAGFFCSSSLSLLEMFSVALSF